MALTGSLSDLTRLSHSSQMGKFEDLQTLAREIELNYQHPVDLNSISSVVFPTSEIDAASLAILPSQYWQSDIKPIRTTGDGNCLFNAASLAVCGTERLSTELRIRTAIELILNTDHYARHPLVTQANINIRNTERQYSPEAIYDVVVFSALADKRYEREGFWTAVEQEIRKTLRWGSFSGIMQIMGLASALKCTVRMIYPDDRHRMFPVLNADYQPRSCNKISDMPTISIMWTHTQGWCDRSKEFKVNHFVPLRKVNEIDEWVLVKRKRSGKRKGLADVGSTSPWHVPPKVQSLHSPSKPCQPFSSTSINPTYDFQSSKTSTSSSTGLSRYKKIQKKAGTGLDTYEKSNKKANTGLDSTYEKSKKKANTGLDSTYEKSNKKANTGLDSTYEKSNKKANTGLDSTYEKSNKKANTGLDSTYEKSNKKANTGLDSTYEKSNKKANTGLDSTYEKSKKKANTSLDSNYEKSNKKANTGLHSTYEKSKKKANTGLDSTYEKSNKKANTGLDSTYEKSNKKANTGLDSTNEKSNKKANTGLDSTYEKSNKKANTGLRRYAKRKKKSETDLESHGKSEQNVETGLDSQVKSAKKVDTGPGSHVKSERKVGTDLDRYRKSQKKVGTGLGHFENSEKKGKEEMARVHERTETRKNECKKSPNMSESEMTKPKQTKAKNERKVISFISEATCAQTKSTSGTSKNRKKPGHTPKLQYLSKKSSNTPFLFGLDHFQSAENSRKSKEENQEDSTLLAYKHGAAKSCCLDIDQTEEEISSFNEILPLATSVSFYKNQGVLVRANKQRTERRRSSKTSTFETNDLTIGVQWPPEEKTGSLNESIKDLEKRISDESNSKKPVYLSALLSVAKHLKEKFPLLRTQDAEKLFREHLQGSYPSTTRATSSAIYDKFAKHLNIIQLYIKGTAFIMENKDIGPIMDFVNTVNEIFDKQDFRRRLNSHIETQVVNMYSTALSYMDTQRDRNTMKCILTKITSVKFMARLQKTQNKSSLSRCRDVVPHHLKMFEELREEICEDIKSRNLSSSQERYLIRRKLEIEKLRRIRTRYHVSVGRKLKLHEFPDLVAIIEYEFGEGDSAVRGGGGLESHAKLRNEILYRASDNRTKMKDAREAIMALAPEDFKISLSTCYNYTQNFRKGTYQARQHHEGRGINACVSLHKAPDTAPIKDLVINIHWTSSNVNFILDEAAKNPNCYCVDSRDAKQIIRPNMGHGGKTWRKIENPDHTYDTSRTNAVTPMTHLFVETKECRRDVTINKQPRIQELMMTNSGKKEVVLHIKRTGKAVTLLNLSNYEPETIFRCVNEVIYLMTLPSLDNLFRNPGTGKMKEVLVSVVDNGIEKPRSPLLQMLLVRLRRLLDLDKVIQVSFAEYHSKRNPVERVHAVHTKQLEKHGTFNFPKDVPADSENHLQHMEKMREEVQDTLNQATFGGTYTRVMKGIGEEKNYVFNDEANLRKFLQLNEDKKATCEMTYTANTESTILKELETVWNIDSCFSGNYTDDYDILNNNYSSDCRTAWTDKYTTVIFNEESILRNTWEQPLPDYVRWYLTDGEMHYMTYEQRTELKEGPWDNVKELFLPSRVLDMAFLAITAPSEQFFKEITLLCWCPEEKVHKWFKNKSEEMEKDYQDSLEQAQWKNHELFAKSRNELMQMCTEHKLHPEDNKTRLVAKLAKKLSLQEPPLPDSYDGNLADIPTTVSQISKLSLFKLKQCLRYHALPWIGSKEELVLRVLALRTGTTNLLFEREHQGLLELMKSAKSLVNAQINISIMEQEFVTRKRAFPTPLGSSVTINRPREAAGAPEFPREDYPVPEKTSLCSLPTIFLPLELYIVASRQALNTKFDPNNLDAIRMCNARVVVNWQQEDKMLNWKPGWYVATVNRYVLESDEVVVEYAGEPGHYYNLKVKDSVDEGTLRLHKTPTVDQELYDQLTEIGANILIKWTKDQLEGSGWRPGWYAAEIQAFSPETDEIEVVYKREPDEIYTECVTGLIAAGTIKLSCQ